MLITGVTSTHPFRCPWRFSVRVYKTDMHDPRLLSFLHSCASSHHTLPSHSTRYVERLASLHLSPEFICIPGLMSTVGVCPYYRCFSSWYVDREKIGLSTSITTYSKPVRFPGFIGLTRKVVLLHFLGIPCSPCVS